MQFGDWWQGLFANDYAPGTSQDPVDRDGGFNTGKYAFSWNGNWAAIPTLEHVEDVVLQPAPDFGAGNRIGAASWQFGISGTTEHPEGGAAFIASASTTNYKEGGRWPTLPTVQTLKKRWTARWTRLRPTSKPTTATATTRLPGGVVRSPQPLPDFPSKAERLKWRRDFPSPTRLAGAWPCPARVWADCAVCDHPPFCLHSPCLSPTSGWFPPSPTEFVGLENYRNHLGVGVLNLEPVKDNTGAVVMEDDGSGPTYPRLRDYTRSNPDYPNLNGKREWFSFDWGGGRTHVRASDVVFMTAIVNTFLFVIFVARRRRRWPWSLLINQMLRAINIFRTIFFMPEVVSIVVVALLWRFIYDGQDGLLNNMLSGLTFGLFRPVDWLGNPSTALYSIIAMSIWQAVGFHMVIWLSDLQTISPTHCEAVAIEGASSWQSFRYIIWPGLRNTAVLILIVITMQAFALFAQIDAMTNGGPVDSTQTIVFQAVERGYSEQDISGCSTIAVVLFCIVLSVSLVERWMTRGRNAKR